MAAGGIAPVTAAQAVHDRVAVEALARQSEGVVLVNALLDLREQHHAIGDRSEMDHHRNTPHSAATRRDEYITLTEADRRL